MISKSINKLLPDDILYSIIEYIKPEKLDNTLQDEIKSEFVFRLFTKKYKHYINNLDNVKKGIQIKNIYHFEYNIMSLPSENYNFYIEQLKKHKNKEKSNYFIKAIKWVVGINQTRDFYDDEFYNEEYYDYDDEYN